MSNQPQNDNPQEMTPDEFFDSGNPPNTTPQSNQPYDIADQLKRGLGQAGYQAGTNMIIQILVQVLPLPYRHKRNIANKIESGQRITIWDIVFGGLSIGRIISFVMSLIIFAVVMFYISRQGLL